MRRTSKKSRAKGDVDSLPLFSNTPPKETQSLHGELRCNQNVVSLSEISREKQCTQESHTRKKILQSILDHASKLDW